MAVFTLTALNWNDVAFWSAINAVNGDTLDMAALPANFTVTYDYTTNSNLQISDGTTTYTIGSAGATGTDVNLASGALDFFDTILMPAGGGNVSLDGDDQTITGAAGADTLDTGAGDDVASGGDGDDSIDGGAGADSLYGEDGDDTIIGGDGNDELFGGAGADSLSGGAGTDWLRYNDASSDAVGSGVNIDLSTNSASGGAAQGDTISGFENVQGGIHDDTLTGDAGNNVLRGGAGDDSIAGGAGTDRIYGQDGADTLDGGDGNDWLDYHFDTEGVTVDLSTNTASGGEAQGDVISNFENIRSGTGDDNLTGAAGNNNLVGQDGDDTLTGGAGHDQLYGGAGADSLSGGDGIDWLRYDDGSSEAVGSGVNIDLLTNSASGGAAQGDTISGFENVWGTSHDDTLTGDAGNNLLRGGDGDDSIAGGDGDDWIMGQDGADTLDGGDGADWLDYIWDTEGVTVDLSTNSASGGEAQGDVISNFEHIRGGSAADNLTGDANNNTFSAGAGDDTIDGGGGDDWINGQAGDDLLTGGAGRDTFRMVAGEGQDTITDFELPDLNITTGTWSSTSGDTLSIGGVLNASGNQVTTDDVTLSDTNGDGTGDVIISFPMGESFTLQGITPSEVNQVAILTAMGIPAGTDDGIVMGGAGDDTIDAAYAGDPDGNVVDGGDALDGSDDDIIHAGAGDDLVQGGDGDDIIIDTGGNSTLSNGDDTFYGGDGDDLIIGQFAGTFAGGTVGTNVFYGGAGNDTLVSGNSHETMHGGDGDDLIYTGNVSQVVYANEGNDTVVGDAEAGTAESDTIYGGAGDDDLSSGFVGTVNLHQGDFIDGGEGNDTVTGGDADDTLTGGAGDDTIAGGGGQDEIRLEDGFGTDSIDGGSTGVDEDTLDAGAMTTGVTVTFSGDEAGTLTDGTNTATFTDIEAVTTGDGDDTILGAQDNTGLTLSSGAGNDNVRGGDGDDTIDGGTGNDTLRGDDGSDSVDGGEGDDSLFGGDGDDSLTGGDGDDRLLGQDGADVIDGGDGVDTAVFNGTTGTDIDLTDGLAETGGEAEGDTITNIEEFVLSEGDDTFVGDANTTRVSGRDGADDITTDAGEQVLAGGTGNDTLSAGAGDDLIRGQEDDDLIDGGAGEDVLYGDEGSDTIDGGEGRDAIYGGDGADVADGGTGDDILRGGDGGDSLTGGDGGDVLMGDAGNDTLDGGAGSDISIMTTGSGTDTFDGGADDDALVIEGGATGADVTYDGAGSGTADLGADSTDFSNVETIALGAGDDTLEASLDTAGMTGLGGAGDDSLTGGSGNDVLSGDGGSWAWERFDIDPLTMDLDSTLADVGFTLNGGTDNTNTPDATGFSSAIHPDALNPGEHQAFKFETELTITQGGNYDFSAVADDNVRVFIDGVEIINGDSQQSATFFDSAAQTLTPGTYTIEVIYLQGGTDQALDLRMSGPDTGGESTSLQGYAGVSAPGAVGNDTLYGGDGDDLIDGGAGDDTLYGGADNDTFVMADGGNADVITDFDMGDDDTDGFTNDQLDVTGLTSDGGTTPVTTDDVVITDTNGDGTGDAILTFPGGESITLQGVTPAQIPDAATLVSMGIPAGTKDYVVDGTAGDDVINGSYTDADGDGVDGNDNLAGTNDDVIDAGDGADLVVAGAGDDSVSGGAGDDTVFGQSGDDTLVGGAGDDVINGDSEFFGHDTLQGGAGNDTLHGNAGDDLVEGGDDADTFLLAGVFGADTIIGGEGGVDQDLLTTTQAGTPITDDITVTFTGNEAGTLTDGVSTAQFSEIEAIETGAGDDTIDATAQTTPGAGIDVATGAGNDSITGGAGQDTIDGGAGDDIIRTGANAGGTSRDTVFGGDGNDTITFEGFNIGQAYGGDGNDSITGSNAAQLLDGGAGNDTISGGDDGATADSDTLIGGDGDDVLTSGQTTAPDASHQAFGDSLDGGAGQDQLVGGLADDTLDGGTGDDALDGGEGADILRGGAGDDELYGNAGNDTLSGGAGNDTIGVAQGSNTIIFSDGDGNDVVKGFAAPTDNGDGTYTSNSAFDVSGLTSDGGTTPVTTDDVVITDTNGDGTGDAILTFPGGESLTLEGVTPAQIPDAATLNSMGVPLGTKDHVVDGTAGDDLIDGSYTDANGDGVDGNDNLAGTNDDVIDAGDGDDTIISSAGADIIDGGAGEDFVDYNGETADLTIDLSDALAESGGDAEGDILTNVEDIRGGSGDDNITGNASDNFLRGASGDDTIDGGAGDDNMIGGGGNDSIIGGDGNDLLYGQLGADTLDGGAGIDQASYVLDNTGINIDLSAGTASGGEAEGDVLTNIEHLRGGSAADTLTGDTAANELRGEGGDDILKGGVGDDTLIGGTGDDTYVFADGSGADVITDFDMGDDDTDGFTNDQLDISGLTDANGDPVNVWDVVITDTNGDGTGDAILTFPNGESLTLQGVTPDQVDTGAELGSMGIVCYVSGTMIRTERGEVAVEHLTDYDKVLTAQGGYEPILWRDHTRVTLAQQKAAENLRPVRIKPQALGNDSALFVSQQHCMVVQIEGKDQFIRAKHLAEFTDMAHIAKPKSDVTYHHILLPEHAVIYANGAASESFYPGPQSLKMLSLKAMSSLVTAISPKATEGLAAAYGQRCLETLSRKSVQALQATPTQGVACAALKAGSSHLAERALVQQQ
ncbi:Hint domain-containing protein [Lentibacter sp.]|uniref:Hint domain-containing protein n=1 Tax=Lentibacter sp. TaxID=2024994 RepID=UPI003F69770A